MSSKNTSKLKRITKTTIHPNKVMNLVKDNKAGATVMFIGTVREEGRKGKIVGMNYESYLEMAEDNMLKIERSVSKTYKVSRVNLLHRVGDLSIGQISVMVAVSAPHRSEAFRACRYAIERIKKEVPIWKKEMMDGEIGIWIRE